MTSSQVTVPTSKQCERGIEPSGGRTLVAFNAEMPFTGHVGAVTRILKERR